MEYRITLHGVVPGIKQHRRQVFIKAQNRWLNVPSDEYRKWEKEIISIVKSQFPLPHRDGENPCSMDLIFHYPDLRVRDMSSGLESIQDMFKRAGVLSDDNRKVLPDVHMRAGSIDKQNPRVEIKITSL